MSDPQADAPLGGRHHPTDCRREGGCIACDPTAAKRPAPPEAGNFFTPTPPTPDQIGELVNDVARLESRSFRANERLNTLEKRVDVVQPSAENANDRVSTLEKRVTNIVDMVAIESDKHDQRIAALERPAPSAAEATRGEAITLHRHHYFGSAHWCSYPKCQEVTDGSLIRTAHFDASSSPQEGKEEPMQNTDNWKHDPTIYAKSPSPRDEGECDFRYPASGYRCGRIRKHHELTDFGHAFVPPAPSESGELEGYKEQSARRWEYIGRLEAIRDQAAQDRAKVLAVEKLVATYRESPQGAAPLWTKFMDDLKRALAGEKAQ